MPLVSTCKYQENDQMIMLVTTHSRLHHAFVIRLELVPWSTVWYVIMVLLVVLRWLK